MARILFFLIALFYTQLSFGQFITNQVFFKLKTDYDSEKIDYSNNQLNTSFERDFLEQVITDFKIKSIEMPFKTVDDKLQSTYLIQFDNKNAQLEELINLLNKQQFVEYAEKVPELKTNLSPNDPQYNIQWHLDKIMAENAWDISLGNSDVVVAVVDDAVRIDHEDLNSVIFLNTNEIPNNGIDDDNNGYVDDVNGWDAANFDNDPSPPSFNLFSHGTHVAGIVGAATNNNTGIASIGFGVSILPVKIKRDNSFGPGLQAGVQGIDYAISCGYTDVVNMSFGSPFYSTTYQNLFNAGHNQGIVFVAASGNSNSPAPFYPAAYDHVISVAASSPSDRKANFSSYGTTVDVTAPGTSIYSTVATSSSSYRNLQGTSMASPLVAGLCALMLSYSPGISPDEVETCLESSCDNIDNINPSYSGMLGAGRINAANTLACLSGAPIANFEANKTTICSNQSVQFTDLSDGVEATSWSWSFPGGSPSSSNQQNPNVTYANIGNYNVSLTVSNADGSDAITKSNYINVSTPTANLSGSTTIIIGGTAFLKVDFAGNPPYQFTYTDGENETSLSNINTNPYYFSVQPSTTTTYELTAMSSADCAGNTSGDALVVIDNNVNPNPNNNYFLKTIQFHIQDYFTAFDTDNQNNIIAVGALDSLGLKKSVVTKFDDKGTVIWSTKYETSPNAEFTAILCGNDNHYYIGGVDGSRNAILLKLDSNGNIVWAKRMNHGNLDAQFMSIVETADGNIVGGFRTFLSNDNYSANLFKISKNGNSIWNRTFEFYNFVLTSVMEHSSGDLYMTAGTGSGTNYQATIAKLSSTGNLIWNKRFGGQGNDVYRVALETNDNNLVLVGSTWSAQLPVNSVLKTFVTKINLSGNIIWSKVYDGFDGTIGSIARSDINSSNQIIIPHAISNQGNTNIGFTLLDNNGNLIKSIKGNLGLSLDTRTAGFDQNGDIIAVGRSTDNSQAGLLIKINQELSALDCLFEEQNLNVTDFNATVPNINVSTVSAFSITNVSKQRNSNSYSENVNYCNSSDTCQSGVQTYYDDNGSSAASSITSTSDGGYIVSGYTNDQGAGNYDLFVTKYDSQNAIQWSKTYGTSSNDLGIGNTIIQTSDGGYFIGTGSKAYHGLGGAAVVLVALRLDNAGNIVWQKRVDNSNSVYANIRSVSEDNGSFIIGGNGNVTNTGQDDAYIIKIDPNGNLSWMNSYQTNANDGITEIKTVSDGYIVSGIIQGSNSILFKLDKDGDYLWSKTYNQTDTDLFRYTEVLNDGSIINFGELGSSGGFRNGYLVKTNASGNTIWAKRLNLGGALFTHQVKALQDGSLICTGNITKDDDRNIFVSKIDPNGDHIWTKFIGTPENDDYIYFRSSNTMLLTDNNSKAYIVATTNSYGGTDEDTWIIKTNLDGIDGCNETICTDCNTTSLTAAAENANFISSDAFLSLTDATYTSNDYNIEAIEICNNECEDSIICPADTSYFESICQGFTTIFSAPEGSNYFWSPNYNISDQGIQNPTFSPAVDTFYTVSYVNAEGCALQDTLYIEVQDTPALVITPDLTTICPGESVQLNVTGGFNYVWTPTTFLSNPNISNPIATPTSSITYTVEASNAEGNCYDFTTARIIVSECCGAKASFVASDTFICVGDSILFTNTSVSAGNVFYVWTFDDGNPSNYIGEQPPYITFNEAGIQKVRLFMDDDCGGDTVEMNIFVSGFPEFNVQQDTFICKTGETFAIPLGDDEVLDFQYSWSPTTNLDDPTSANPIATIASSAQYMVEVTDANTQCKATKTVSISIDTCIIDTCQAGFQVYYDDDGNSAASSIVATADGGYIISGYTNTQGAGDYDLFVTKYSGTDDIQWSKTYGTADYDLGIGNTILQTADGGYFVGTGSKSYHNVSGPAVILVALRLNSSGDIVWQKRASIPADRSINVRGATLDNGDFIISGNTTARPGGQDEAYVLKIDQSGNLNWMHSIETGANDGFTEIKSVDDGYVTAGISNGSRSLLAKYNKNGLLQWSRNYNQNTTNLFRCVDVLIDGSIISFGEVVDGGISSVRNGYLVKTDENGNTIWSKELELDGSVSTHQIKALQDGSLICSGSVRRDSNSDVFITKLSANGNHLWTKFIGTPEGDEFIYFRSSNTMLVNDNETNATIVGATDAFEGGNDDTWIIKTTLNNVAGCNEIVCVDCSTNDLTANATNVTASNDDDFMTLTNANYISGNYNITPTEICAKICEEIPCPNDSTYYETICKGTDLTFSAPDGSNYSWFPVAGVSNPNIQAPTFTPTANEFYIVNYTDVNDCDKRDTLFITVLEQPVLSLAFDDTLICLGDTIQLQAFGADTYIWSPATSISNTIISNPLVNPEDYTQYTVIGTDTSNCSDTAYVDVEVMICCENEASFAVDSNACLGATVTIENTSIISDNVTFDWSFENGNPSTFTGTNPPEVFFEAEGSQTVTMVMTDECSADTVMKTITINELPKFNIEDSIIVCETEEAQAIELEVVDVDKYNYTWSPADLLDNANSANPTATITESIQFVVEVIDSLSGCVIVDTLMVELEECIECKYFVAEAFSPNGDNNNDFYKIPSQDVESLHITIVDKWGEVVYESNDVNFEWDGTFRGKLLPTDVYGFYLEIKCEGEETTIIKQGNITLLR